jgi:hypothetical protein
MADNSKRDNLIEDYRTVVTNTILSNEVIVDFLSEGRLTVEEPDELLWTHLVPQQYVPETITETGSYILYDIDENVLYSRNSTRSTYTELTLYFWIFTHKSSPLYKGRLRNDVLSRELKAMFNEIDNMGIGKNHLLYNKVYNSGNYKYMGRMMAFKITDWSDKIRLS